MNRFLLPAALLGAVISSPAHAAIPPAVDAMLEAAIEDGDEKEVAAIAKFAVQTNPDSADEINAKVEAFQAKLAAADEAKKAAELEAKRSAGFFQNWSGQGELGAFRSSGNSSNTGITVGLKLKKEGIKWRYKFSALGDYQRSNGNTTREQFVTALELNYKFDDRLYAYALGQYERDRFQGYSARYSASGGLGYHLVNSDSLQIDLKAGPAWRQTQFVGGGTTDSLAGHANADLAWKIADKITLNQKASAYLESNNTSLTSLTSLDAKLGAAVTARLSYQIERDSNPPAGLANTDSLSRITVIYGF